MPVARLTLSCVSSFGEYTNARRVAFPALPLRESRPAGQVGVSSRFVDLERPQVPYSGLVNFSACTEPGRGRSEQAAQVPQRLTLCER